MEDNTQVDDPTIRPHRNRRLPVHFRDIEDENSILSPDIMIVLPEALVTDKEVQAVELATKLRSEGKIATQGPPFQESRRTEMAGLESQGVFKFITVAEVPQGVRVFKSRFVDDVKGVTTQAPYEKSRLVIQAYNDHGKKEILTQSLTI